MNKTRRKSTAITISLPRWARTHYTAVAEANGARLSTFLRLTLLENIIDAKDIQEAFADVLKRNSASRGKR